MFGTESGTFGEREPGIEIGKLEIEKIQRYLKCRGEKLMQDISFLMFHTFLFKNQKFKKAHEIGQPDKKRIKLEFDKKKMLFAKIPLKLVVNKNVACLMTLLVVCAVNMGPYW